MPTDKGWKSRSWLTLIALSATPFIVLANPSNGAEGQGIGQPLPSGVQPSPISGQTKAPTPSDLKSATLGLPGKRVADILSKASMDKKRRTTRGKREIELYKKVSPSVVFVVTSNDTIGSGSYIGSNQIITNWHVVKDAEEVGVFFKTSQRNGQINSASYVRASVVKLDRDRDLALLKVAQVPDSVSPLQLSSNAELQVGADVHAIGHPEGERWTYTIGIISNIHPDYQWKDEESPLHRATVIQTQTPINVGSSGGPLLDDSGRIVGMNSFFKPTAPGLNYAVSADDISTFLESPGEQPPPRKKLADRLCEKEKLYEGRNQDNMGVLIQYDTNCDAIADASLFFPDDESKSVQLFLDTNFDGKTDITVEDQNRDEKWDRSFRDVDFDGVIDLVGYHLDGQLTPSRYEKYASNFSRLNR